MPAANWIAGDSGKQSPETNLQCRGTHCPPQWKMQQRGRRTHTQRSHTHRFLTHRDHSLHGVLTYLQTINAPLEWREGERERDRLCEWPWHQGYIPKPHPVMTWCFQHRKPTSKWIVVVSTLDMKPHTATIQQHVCLKTFRIVSVISLLTKPLISPPQLRATSTGFVSKIYICISFIYPGKAFCAFVIPLTVD